MKTLFAVLAVGASAAAIWGLPFALDPDLAASLARRRRPVAFPDDSLATQRAVVGDDYLFFVVRLTAHGDRFLSDLGRAPFAPETISGRIGRI